MRKPLYRKQSCRGQCVLMKKLKEQQEKVQQPNLKLKEVVLFAYEPDHTCIDVSLGYEQIIEYALFPEFHYQFRTDQTIFYPPIA